jgi:8-oxo-dGTP pyrophosphatase MutT (NUDIX family)
MASLDWKLLHSEYIYKSDWLTARKDRCLTPAGKIVDPYYVLEYPGWVNALAIADDGKVIMVRQYRHGYGQTILEIPGGAMDPADASPEVAMRRELLEETGYAFEQLVPLGDICPNPASSNNLTYMFLATGGKKVQEQKLDQNEEIEIVIISMDELKQLLKANQIRQALHVTCIFYAMQYLETTSLPQQ